MKHSYISDFRTGAGFAWAIVPLLFVIGCDLAKPTPRPESAAPRTESALPGETIEATTIETAAPTGAEEAKPETERVKAAVGAGKKGHYGENEGEKATGIITVPVATLWRAQEMAAYNISVPAAMNLYKANHDGKGPPTHEEFMKEIIRFNQINLPQLPDGHQYVYDPETEQLMIEKPK